jgi:hypothetical protein
MMGNVQKANDFRAMETSIRPIPIGLDNILQFTVSFDAASLHNPNISYQTILCNLIIASYEVS